MANGWGGARPGSGPKSKGYGAKPRTPGTRANLPTPEKAAEAAERFEASKRRREIIDRVTMANVTPLEVMTGTMMAMWNAAHSGPTLDLGLATQACNIAKDCAPYLHPRLAMTAISVDNRTASPVSPEEARVMEDVALAAAFGAAGANWPLLEHAQPASPTEIAADAVDVEIAAAG